jgi:GNAT superfamily N-acetyltransferase
MSGGNSLNCHDPDHVPPVIIVRGWSQLQELTRIESAAAERFREVGYDPRRWPATSVEEFVEYRDLGLLWVAVANDRAVGFAVVDEYGPRFHLEEIDVLPEYHGRGIGTSLMRAVLDVAQRRGREAVTLRTFITTPWSVPLYEKLGFCRWDPDPMPEYLAALIDEERRLGLPIDQRLSMRVELSCGNRGDAVR